MPMLDIQRRHAEVFRIRLGDKTDKGAPRKLTDSIRITSPSEQVVRAFADAYGGDVQPWNTEGQQWQVYLPTTEIPVMVLPGNSISQWWEMYRGSVCERRCDGYTEQLGGQPCVCPPDLADRMADRNACRPTTRINVLCPDVEVVGAGSLVTHGMVAAETLPQSIAVAEAALARGLMVPAVLRIVEHKGKRHYVVPQLEIVGVSLTALSTGEVSRPTLAAPARAEVAAGPPAAIGPGGGGSTAPPPAPRPIEQPPLPGEEPVEFDRAPLIARAKMLPPEWQKELNKARQTLKLPALTNGTFTQEQHDRYVELLETQEGNACRKLRSDLGRKTREFGLEDEQRHEFVAWVTGGAAGGLTECDLGQLLEVEAAVGRLESGQIDMAFTPEGVAEFTAVEAAAS